MNNEYLFYDDEDPEDDDFYPEDADGVFERSEFADPGGNSSLRASSRNNPRNRPCPTCGKSNRLTPADVKRGYQCDECADRDEGVGFCF